MRKPLLVLAAAGLGFSAAATAGTAPGPRDVLRAALQLRDLPLSAHPSCLHAGPDTRDRTVGDYLAGMLAEMDQPSNTVETACQERPGGKHRCTLWLKHRDEEERWAWGLEFELDPAMRPMRQTVRCVGAG